jgi:hypothetical protein
MLTIGVLSWKSHKTLRNTLQSYEIYGLTELADEKIIFFQEIAQEDIDIANEFGYKAIGSPTNIGIAGGYKELVSNATGSLFLFLENDWVLIEEAQTQIVTGAALLAVGGVDMVKYRHRILPGAPLWSAQFAGNEMSRPEYLLDSLHWLDNPDQLVTDYGYYPIKKLPYGWYIADSRFANWTNNPTMFNTRWIKAMSYQFDGDIERGLQGKWQQYPMAMVAQGDGLFTHNRIG